MKELVLATLNLGKFREMQDILGPYNMTLRSLRDVFAIEPPEEKGSSFRENAVAKASHYSAATSLPCIADDSGLSVDVLSGAPGIYSSRYAGEGASDDENIHRLLSVLSVYPRPWVARFICSAAFADGGKVVAIHDGVLEGEIIPERRGSSGFGYDPVFLLRERALTVAEIGLEEKNRISHRRKALEGLMRKLRVKKII